MPGIWIPEYPKKGLFGSDFFTWWRSFRIWKLQDSNSATQRTTFFWARKTEALEDSQKILVFLGGCQKSRVLVWSVHIWSNYSDLIRPISPREIPLFQGNPGWWNIIIWPDISWPFQEPLSLNILWTNLAVPQISGNNSTPPSGEFASCWILVQFSDQFYAFRFLGVWEHCEQNWDVSPIVINGVIGPANSLING